MKGLSRLVRMDSRTVVVLYSIYTNGSLTKAGDDLFMTQPAISKVLDKARSVMGDDLFIRHRRGVNPSEKMTAAMPDIERIINLTCKVFSAFDICADDDFSGDRCDFDKSRTLSIEAENLELKARLRAGMLALTINA